VGSVPPEFLQVETTSTTAHLSVFNARADSDAEEPFLNWVVGDTIAHYDEYGGWMAAALRERGWR
jgi:hypothetical protein